MIALKLARALVLGSAVALTACGGDGLVVPREGEPAHIEVIYGDGQSARADSMLADSVVVLVTDTKDRPVPGANVNFTFPDADAAAAPATAATNADGVAWAKVTLGSQVGPVAGVADVPVDAGFTPVRVEFTAMTLPGNASGIVAVSGDAQSAPVNSELPLPLVVRVSDASNNPIPGQQVTWEVTGGGSVSSATTVTGADGTASVTRTLGPTAGQQTAVASAPGLAGSPVTFTHTATPGGAAGVNKVSGDGQSAQAGTELGAPLVVRVLDAEQNPIPNRAVTWIVTGGGGSVSQENSTTNAQGEASTRWTLGPAAGSNSLNAVVSGVGTATFTATGTAGTVSASNSTVTASPGTIAAGSGSSTVTVTVRDASNNPIAGVAVSIASSGSGNTITPASASSGPNGVATFTFSSTVAESKTITATAGGVTINDQETIAVQRTASTTRIESDDPDPSEVGQSVRVVFTVTGAAGTPTGRVTITAEGGSETCSGTVAEGFCNLTFTSSGANRRLNAAYEGDSQFAGSTDRENHRVNDAPATSTTTTITSDTPEPSDAGATITVSFTVTSTAGTPTGTVQVTDPQGGSCSASVAAGSCQYVPGGTGTRTITATYAGGSGFAGSSDTEDHMVNPPSSSAPVALEDAYATPSPAGSQLSVGYDDRILKNDSDLDTDNASLVVDLPLVENASAGTLNVDVSGTFQYTPNAGTTTDSFRYRARDPQGNLSNIVTVTITVTP